MKIVSITGPSCAGKTTLVRELLKNDNFCEVVSFTSRSPRAGEVHGKDYYFLSKEECQKIIDNNAAAEHIEFKGNIYGIERGEISTKVSAGKVPLVILEPHGLIQMAKMYGNELYAVYVDAPLELLYERFLDRFSNDVRSNYITSNSDGFGGGTLDVRYAASRIKGIQEEHNEWRKNDLVRNFYIDHFTSDNKESIIESLLDVLLKGRSKSD